MLQIRAAMISQQWQNHWQRAVLRALGAVAETIYIMQICYAFSHFHPQAVAQRKEKYFKIR